MSPREIVSTVVDPELPVVTIAELGILREVSVDDATATVTVTITPTYSGCPAIEAIRADIRRTLSQAGYPDVEVTMVLHPPWSTDMISQAGREKLALAGIAPPAPGSAAASPARSGPVGLRLSVRCPRCGSPDTEELSRFGSTACLALWRCRDCAEPFQRVKPL